MNNGLSVRLTRVLPALMVIITVLSQFKWDYQGYVRYALYGIWFITFIYFVVKNGGVICTNFGVLFVTAILGVAMLCGTAILTGDSAYAENVMLGYMPISCFAYFLGGMIYRNSSTDIKQILHTYCVSCVILAVFVRIFNYSSMSDWYSSLVYTYGSGKNQIGMVLASATIIILFLIFPNVSRGVKLLCVIGALAMVYAISLVQCRTALIALAVSIGFGLFINRKLKLPYIIIGVVIVVLLLSNDTVWNYIDHVFLISKYAGQGNDAMLSGRLTYYAEAWESIKEHWFFGVGDYYVDCLYLELLAEGGLFEFMFVFPVMTTRMAKSIPVYRDDNFSFKGIAAIMAVYYLVTSFLEAQTPFGPGTSSCMFWLLSGYLDTEKAYDVETSGGGGY